LIQSPDGRSCNLQSGRKKWIQQGMRLGLQNTANNSPLWAWRALVWAFTSASVGLWALVGSNPDRASAQPLSASFTADIQPILQSKCLACHSSSSKMGGLVMENYESLMKGGIHGPSIIPGKSEESRIFLMLEGKVQPRMPFGGDPMPAEEIATIKAWIDAGAKGPMPGETSAPLKPLAIPDIKPQVPTASPVASLRFSPDGKVLAAGGYKEVRLLDPATGKAVASFLGHADYVRSLAFSPDGQKLAAAGGLPQQGGEIKVWDLATRKLLKTMKGHSDCIYSVAWSPDGRLLASGSYDKLIKLWDVASSQEMRTLKDHIDAVFAVAFSPDGKWLASGSQDRSVKIWDVASGQRLYTLSEPLDGITTLAFSPSGKQLAAGGYDRTIYIWNLGDKQGTLAQSLIADEDSIIQLAWSPGGKVLVSSSSDGTIRFRDAETLDPLKVLSGQADWVQALAVSPDGGWLAAGRYDGTLSVYDMKSYKQVLGPTLAFEEHLPSSQQARAVAGEAHTVARARATREVRP
jgi:dipeptidyl aminopeptidase/acylaminoacyl peptidase